MKIVHVIIQKVHQAVTSRLYGVVIGKTDQESCEHILEAVQPRFARTTV